MITASNIHKSFGDVEVLKGAGLSVSQGEVVALVGASGAGKTTLLQILGTLMRPDAGSVVYDGTDVYGLSDAELSRFRNSHIGFVFQLHRLLPEFSLVENVAMPALIGGASLADARKRAMELLDYLGLASRASHRPAQLSGGEAQRGAVARALINRPSVVLADEPSGSLDSRNRAELHRLFFDLRRDMGATFLIVTHDEALAAECDRTVRMADGLVLAPGDV
ncbi:MAG: ABC transporter ATP-binding protein [Muribaculaceae bacterium]|nr:ABC transporter ATP-binding protein [Muribaculaceae bacterium]MDE6285678.1 ABC transporter ATP-binding protein [Muribaculaceae bacterium]